jgi:hypothetical protein
MRLLMTSSPTAEARNTPAYMRVKRHRTVARRRGIGLPKSAGLQDAVPDLTAM